MTTLQAVELGVLGPLQVRQDGALVTIPGAKPRAILTMLGLHVGSVVSADTLVELLWSQDPPRTAAKALQTHISSLRRTLGDGFVVTEGSGWSVAGADSDALRYKSAARRGRDAAAAGDTSRAVACFEDALSLWRGLPELPDSRRGTSEKTRWIEGHAALVEDRADALLVTGRAAEIIGELESAVADAPLRERRWAQLMLALYRAGRQGEALGAYQRARTLLAEELGVDPGPELRRLEAAIVAQDSALEVPAAQNVSSVMRAVTFLLTDIEGSTAAWEADAGAMATALARHDELVEQVVTSRGGRLIKTRGEGDATFSVFDRPSAAAAAALEVQEAITYEPWALKAPLRVRVALHTGEAEFRDGDYFGRAVNRAARLRSLAEGGQIVCSGATAELVIDSLADDVLLVDLGTRPLRNLARPEHVFELRLVSGDDNREPVSPDAPLERPSLPAVLAGPGPFVGRGSELAHLYSAWQTTLAGATNAVLIAGEPGVGKTRLAGEWSRQAYDQGAVVLYGRCDEDLGAPYQPFAEALRSLVPCLGASRLRGLRGVEALLPLVPGLCDLLPDLAPPTRADPDTERYALFDAVVALLGLASASPPVVLILDDLHWAAKPTLLLLRHLLRFGEHARVQIVGTYRSTDLDRSHPLAAMLADLHRDGTAHRLSLGGLDEDEVSAYVAEAGYDDEELGRALASVTGGNPFFLIEALRHVDESGGHWDQSTLPQGVREAVSRRLSRLAPETNKALGAAAVVGSRFALELVERVVGDDLVDAFDEACKAGIVIEEPEGRYRFNHALVRQSLLAELPSVRRMRLHQRIATTLESEPGADDELLAELAYHYFECAWAGNAGKAVEYCRRAADQAMARLAYEGAADLYDRAVHALEEIDDELPDRADQAAELLIARCEALLAAGDVTSAVGAVAQLQTVTVNSDHLAAWAACFDGQLSMLTHPERLDEVEAALGLAATRLAELDDAAGEAKAHTVRAGCLARLGRIGDCEIALDDALTAARRAREHRRVNAVLANAPLAALWGPSPVPRAGGRCLDVVRLLRITTDSPAVEVTSTRCQAVLEALRGRDAAARRMADAARRMVTESGLRHALLEVEQFAGIIELVADEPAAAEPCFRKAYNGFRRLGLDADVAETAALLGRTYLALDRDAEAAELCSESERLAGDALKASIAWRTLRAQLLSRSDEHAEARQVAEAAVALAERTDALVDHGDACLTLAVVLGAAGDTVGQRAAAERALSLYELKGATALAEKARRMVGERDAPPVLDAPEARPVQFDSDCVQAICRLDQALNDGAWRQVAAQLADVVKVESRQKIVGFPCVDISPDEWIGVAQHAHSSGWIHYRHTVLVVRGERLALVRLVSSRQDVSPGAPQMDLLQLFGLDEEGRIALQVWFDVEDVDAAIAELDAVYERSEEPPAKVRLENSASQTAERFLAHFAAQQWDAMAEMLADGFCGDDRRPVVGSGLRSGRDDQIADLKAIAELWSADATSTVIATRGSRLALLRLQFLGGEPGPQAFVTEVLSVVETNSGGQTVAWVVFGSDDLDAAFAELDARFAASEAAVHARTWSVLVDGFVALNRRELPDTTPDWVNIDHRRVTSIAPGEMRAVLGEAWKSTSDLNNFIVTVHRLNALGAVVTHVAHENSQEGFSAEWRVVSVVTVDGNMISRCEVFDEADLDAATARLAELSRTATRLENTAARIFHHVWSHYAAGDWEGVAATVADDYLGIDHRRVVSAETQRGRDNAVRDMRATADVGFTMSMVSALAIRGERLVLASVRGSGGDAETIENDALNVVEVDADERIATVVVYDLEDFDAALAELEVRYTAGEAAPYANTWSAVADAYVSLRRDEFPAMTPDAVSIDHRRAASFAPGELKEYIRAGFDLGQHLSPYIESVYRLNALGAVVAHATKGHSREGFDAEWRGVNISMVQGNLISRSELFDEMDLDVAIARFDELSRPPERPASAASQAYERFQAYFAARDWDAMSDLLAHNVIHDGRRRIVGAGLREGRAAFIAAMTAMAGIGVTRIDAEVIATRGRNLVLSRSRASGRDERPDAFHTDVLNIVEIDAAGKFAAYITLDPEDIDAAITELDARYLAGEAAAHSHTWATIAGSYAALNRREPPITAPDCVSIDHRGEMTFGPSDLLQYFDAGLNLDQGITAFVAEVHRLSSPGGVITYAAHETSQDGFEAEWRGVAVLTIDGDMVNRCEVFDEADVDAAIARFEVLQSEVRRLGNPASRGVDRYLERVVARDWDAVADMLAADYHTDDRRHLVGGGIYGRDAEIASVQAQVDLGVTQATSTVIAVRGERLALSRLRYSGHNQGLETFVAEMLVVFEVKTGDRFAAAVAYDLDDLDAAITELDARYLAGEAAARAHAWRVITQVYATLNGGQIPSTTSDFVDIDHRRLAVIGSGDLKAYLTASMADTTDSRLYVEAVHRLTDFGAVVTHVASGTSRAGFAADWRITGIYTVEGDLINRYEVFEDSELHAALARFEELHPPKRKLENTASRVSERAQACFATEDWAAITAMGAEDFVTEDRRRVISAGIHRGRDENVANLKAASDIGFENLASTVIATRGERLLLDRVCFSGRDPAPEPFRSELLRVFEIDAEDRIAASIFFDPDDIDAAYAELDSRYLSGDATPYANTWSAVLEAYAAFNRHEMPPTTPDWVNVDHRRAATIAPGDLAAHIRATRDIAPHIRRSIEAVHRLDNLGAVVTHIGYGTSQEGFDAEWRLVALLTFAGDLISRAELFDETDLDAALARFDELRRPAH